MIWNINNKDNSGYSPSYHLKNYPFFSSLIKTKRDGSFETNTSEKFASLDEAKQALITQIKSVCLECLIATHINDFKKSWIIRCNYTDWSNNNGNGKYIDKELYKKFHWINGTFYTTSCIAKAYAIRYDISTSKENVEKHALKILKRHARRFLKEINSTLST